MAKGAGAIYPNSPPDNKSLPPQISHIRIAAPAMVYQQETMLVHECATMATTGTFLDPVPRVKHQQNTNLEVNNFDTTVVGTISYDGGHSHCEGMQTSLNGHKMVSLLTTKNLEVTVQSVTIQEDFDSGDIAVMENSVSIPVAF